MQLHKQIFNRKNLFLVQVIILGIILRSNYLYTPLLGLHDFRQTQTASNVWLYHKFGFNPFVYHVPMFGGKYWILEFPLYQIVTYAVSLISGVNDLNGKIVSILSYIISTVALYLISKIILNSVRYSLYAILLFSLIPLTIYYYSAYLPDPFILALSLSFIASLLIIKKKQFKLLYFFTFALIILLSKFTIFFSNLLPLIYLVKEKFISQRIFKHKLELIKLILYSLIFISLILMWLMFARYMNSQSPTLENGTIREWFLGTKFVDINYYFRIIKRLDNELSTFGLVFLTIGIYFLQKKKSFEFTFIKLWLLNILLYLFVFNNLNDVHNYYQLPVIPVLIICIILGLKSLTKLKENNFILRISPLLYLFLFSFYSLYNYRVNYSPSQDYSNMILSNASVIQQCTSENDKIVYIQPNLDSNHPTVLYYSKRIGYNFDLFNLPEVNKLIISDKDIKNLVFYPVSESYKKSIIKVLTNQKLTFIEKCFVNNVLILKLI